jgi:hypothetical protein
MPTATAKPVFKIKSLPGDFHIVTRGTKTIRVQPVTGEPSFLVAYDDVIQEGAPVVSQPEAQSEPRLSLQNGAITGFEAPTALDILAKAKSTTSKTKKSPDRLHIEDNPTLETLADKIITQKKICDEADREWEKVYGEYKAGVKKFRTDTIAQDPTNYSKTVEIQRGDCKVQASFWNFQNRIDETREPELKEVFGEEFFPKLFTRKQSISVKPKAIETEEKLKEVAQLLMDKLGPDTFLSLFDFSSDIVPTPECDKVQFELSESQRTTLNNIGLTQKVVVQVR